MSTYHGRRPKCSLVHFLIVLPVGFIVVAILLMSSLLSTDSCKCPKTEFQILHGKVENVVHPGEHRLAILVPFRDRFDELLIFAPYMRNFLNEQKINHDIFVINQVDRFRFNRASLINVGYLFTKKVYDYVAMHDVDLLPLNKNLSYAYPKDQPFHVAAPNLHPRYHYSKFVGGILLVNREHFNLVNGMSNKYWGWGLEDDEFYVRLRDANLNVTRPVNITTGTANTFRHVHDKQHRKRDTLKCFNQLESTRRRDYITGLHNVDYKINNVHELSIDGATVTVINVELKCNVTATPWCDCSAEKKTKTKS